MTQASPLDKPYSDFREDAAPQKHQWDTIAGSSEGWQCTSCHTTRFGNPYYFVQDDCPGEAASQPSKPSKAIVQGNTWVRNTAQPSTESRPKPRPGDSTSTFTPTHPAEGEQHER